MPDLSRQISDLSEQIAALERRLGEVCGNYVEITTAMAPFLTRYRAEVIRYHRALVLALREVADVRAYRGDHEALNSGEVQSPLERILLLPGMSVQEQYERSLKAADAPNRPSSEPELPSTSRAVSQLYARCVATLHPDLTDDADERRRRVRLFNEVNAAYLRRDESALRLIADDLQQPTNLPALVDDSLVDEMRDRVYDLEALTERIEGQYFDMRYGDLARVRAYVQEAEAEGRDLIALLSEDLQAKLRATVEELAQLKSDLQQM